MFWSLFEGLNLKNGVEIPAAAIIVVPVQLVQMDSLNWGVDAREFNPHRFLSTRNGDGCSLGDKEQCSGKFCPFAFVFVNKLFDNVHNRIILKVKGVVTSCRLGVSNTIYQDQWTNGATIRNLGL